jgi:hypothetical protein
VRVTITRARAFARAHPWRVFPAGALPVVRLRHTHMHFRASVHACTVFWRKSEAWGRERACSGMQRFSGRCACGVWRAACGVWRVACCVWRVACGVWRVACGVWRVACCVLHVMRSCAPSAAAGVRPGGGGMHCVTFSNARAPCALTAAIEGS